MILYARINEEGFINGFSDKENDLYNTVFEIDENDINDLSACSGQCFKIENGKAVKKKDVEEFLLQWQRNRQKLERITLLKNKLTKTDYKAIKFAEGLITSNEYEIIKNERQEWRDEINLLETDN